MKQAEGRCDDMRVVSPILPYILRISLTLSLYYVVTANLQWTGDRNISSTSSDPVHSCSTGDDINREQWKASVAKSHVLSQRPLILLFKNCITESEQKELLELVEQRLTAETNSGSSSSIYLQEKSDARLPIVRQIARLAGMISKLPWKHAEPMSLTKYTTGQNYGLHYDSGFYMQGKRGKRMGTFLVYLNDVKSGGETIFPYATNDTSKIFNEIDVEKPPIKDVCSAQGLLKVLPRARNCLLFHNHLSADFGGVRDAWSLHGSCPVISGEKLIAQIWLHDEPWGEDSKSFWTN